MNPFVNMTELNGQRIYSIETQAGVVHLIADAVYENVSDAMRAIKGVVNPVVEAMIAEELAVSEPVELKG